MERGGEPRGRDGLGADGAAAADGPCAAVRRPGLFLGPHGPRARGAARLAALHGPSGQIRLLGDGVDLAGIRLPGLTCLYQGWLGGERLSDEELGAPCVRALERHGVVLPRRFDALVAFDKPRAGFHGILIEAKSGAQSFADTVHQLKAYRAALREQLPGPLLVWGVVEGGGDRTVACDAEALRAAALEREEGQDLWLFTSEWEIREALEAVGLAEPETVDGPRRGLPPAPPRCERR